MTEKIFVDRCLNNGLLTPFLTIQDCVSELKGVQAQIYTAAKISIFNRTRECSNTKIKELLNHEKQLINAWGQRNTLHIYTIKDWTTIVSSNKGNTSWFKKKYLNNLNRYDQLYNQAEQFLKKRDFFLRSDFSFLEKKYGQNTLQWGGILMDLSLDGLVCKLEWNVGEKAKCYGYVPKWFGNNFDYELHSKDSANIQLLDGYFKSYGPATLKDFAHWRGVTLQLAKGWLSKSEHTVFAFKMINDDYFINEESNSLRINFSSDFTRLLYRFDPLLLAYKNKSWLINEKFHKLIWQSAGHVNPVIIQNNTVAAIWNFKLVKNNNTFFSIKPLCKISQKEKKLIINCCVDLSNFLNAKIGKVHFE